MGYYVNPADGDKTGFAKREGEPVSPDNIPPIDVASDETIYVCWKFNGAFDVLGILYNDREKEDFARPSDLRPTEFYAIPKSSLTKDNAPDFVRYLENLNQ